MSHEHQSTRRRGRFTTALVAMVSMVALVVGCSGGTSTEDSASGTSTLTALDYGGLFNFPLVLAEREGILDKHGLQIKYVTASSGPAGVAALASGDVDFGENTLDGTLVARSKGIDLVEVTGQSTSAIWTLVARKDLMLPHLEQGFPAVMQDLKGKNIGIIARGASSDNIVRYLLDEAGLDPEKDVTLLPVGAPATSLPALKTGAVDALMLADPWVTKAVDIDDSAKMVVDLRTGSVPALDWSDGQYITARSTLDKKRGSFERLRVALGETYALMHDPANEGAVAKVMAEVVTDGDMPYAKAVMKNSEPHLGPTVKQGSVDRASQFLINLKLIDAAAKPNDFLWPYGG